MFETLSAEIIAIGSELLAPDRTDTNSLWLTEKLNSIGIEVKLKTIVGDDDADESTDEGSDNEGGGGYGDSINLRGFSANSDITTDGIRDSAQYTRSDNFNLESIELVNGANSAYSGASAGPSRAVPRTVAVYPSAVLTTGTMLFPVRSPPSTATSAS